ncbi:MAG TPA: response regulator transcription factor [Bacteroidota bacterium]|nr:response regulator transcription factor [Bacteroidota bacterium]
MSIRVSLVEDNSELREGLTQLISAEPSCTLVGAYGRCEDLLASLTSDRPDVVVLDIGLPGMSGVEAVGRIKSLAVQTEILMLTVYDDEENIFEAIRSGASGYLLKKTLPGKLLEAIREIHSGGVPMSASIARKVLAAFKIEPTGRRPEEALSVREREVLSALVAGKSYKMIADDCFISIDTVRSHIKNIYEKLHVHSKSEAVAAALKSRIV